jgi:hypothetical protein
VALHSETFRLAWQHYATTITPSIFVCLTSGLAASVVYWLNGLFMLLLEVRWPSDELQQRIDDFRMRYKVQKGSLLNVALDGPTHRPGELRVLHVMRNLLIGTSRGRLW